MCIGVARGKPTAAICYGWLPMTEIVWAVDQDLALACFLIVNTSHVHKSLESAKLLGDAEFRDVRGRDH